MTTTHQVTLDRGPHVIEGLVQWFSATVLTAADEKSVGGCQRKHWFLYVDPSRKEQPPTKKQGIGILIHEELEGALTGAEGILSALALSMLREAGAHRGGLEGGWVETEVGSVVPGPVEDRMLCAGVPFYGHADVVVPRKSVNEVEILDWKTTSSITKWAKTGPELLETIQMPAYGEWAARRWAVPRIRLTHIYGQTDGKAPPARRSHLASRDEIASRWEYVETVGRRVIEHAPCESPEDVPANPEACGAYGGCPFRARCSVGRKTMLEGAKMGLMSKMKEKAAAPAPEPEKAPEQTVEAQLAALEAEAAKARAALLARGSADVPETGIVPSDAPPSEHPLPEEETKKKGRGRPKGSTNKKPSPELPPTETPTPSSAPPAESPKAGGFLLEVYVDCVVTFPAEPFHPVLAKLCRELCDDHGALDVRCAPADSHLAFGRWKGYLAAKVEDWAKTASGPYTLDTRGSEIAEVASEVLRASAPVYVRGIR